MTGDAQHNDGAITQYNFGAIEERAWTIQNLCQQREQILDEISADVNDLASRWQGQSAEQWHVIQTEWNTQAQTEKDDLVKLNQAVSAASEGMSSTENEISGMFSR